MANTELADRLETLRVNLSSSVIGQDDAIDEIMGSLERFQAGLHDGKRPIGTFLFMGPTGTGKTYTVEKFAELTQHSDAFIRIDCSEFSLDHEVAKILGSPPGYLGHESGSSLTRQIDKISNPHNGFIVLLDEIEKAHPKFFDLWLQVMDAGIMTDAKGKKLDFTKSMIFFTSNVGGNHFADNPQLGYRSDPPSNKSIINQVTTELKKTFRPEFLNRLTSKVIFHPLTQVQQEQIFTNMVEDLNIRLKKSFITLTIGPKFTAKLYKDGFSKEYGARELKRTIIKQLEQPLAKAIIHGSIMGDSRIVVELDADNKFSAETIGQYPILLEASSSS